MKKLYKILTTTLSLIVLSNAVAMDTLSDENTVYKNCGQSDSDSYTIQTVRVNYPYTGDILIEGKSTVNQAVRLFSYDLTLSSAAARGVYSTIMSDNAGGIPVMFCSRDCAALPKSEGYGSTFSMLESGDGDLSCNPYTSKIM